MPREADVARGGASRRCRSSPARLRHAPVGRTAPTTLADLTAVKGLPLGWQSDRLTPTETGRKEPSPVNHPASTTSRAREARLCPGARLHAGLGLIAVVLAYLGIALGGAQTFPSRTVAGLAAIGADAHRPHLVQRDRAQAAVTHREIDPPRADHPTGAAIVSAVFPSLVGSMVVLGRAAVAGIGGAPTFHAFLPRGPPEDVRPAAA